MKSSIRLRPKNLPPIIGATFMGIMTDEELRNPDSYKQFLDLAARHSAYTLLTLAIRKRPTLTPLIRQWLRDAVAYAKQYGFQIILEADIRTAIAEFKAAYPDELQERLKLQEFTPGQSGATTLEMEYAERNYCAFGWYPPLGMQLERVYAYQKTDAGIETDTVEDITKRCSAVVAPYTFPIGKTDYPAWKLRVTIPAGLPAGRTVCVVARVTLDYPDVFSPHFTGFETEMAEYFRDLPVDGLMKDECGIPVIASVDFAHDCFWYSRRRAAAYAQRTGGRDMVRDSLLMYQGERGRDAERQGAINHHMELTRAQVTKIGENHYQNAKTLFGPQAFVGVHETVIPYPDVREFERNGLNWWTARRDYAQTDETTPYCCRTSLAKKFSSTVWYNQWYAPRREVYEKKIWSYALAGGRMNLHPLHRRPDLSRLERQISLYRGNLQRAVCRIGLLDYITKTPLDCPVAVIFGHAVAMNWAGPAFENVGMEVSDAFWRAGYYADLIPSSELGGGILRVDQAGDVWFGPQRYAAVVVCNPQYEGQAMVEFLRRAAQGTATLARLGEWTLDFDGHTFDGNNALPGRMLAAPNASSCAAMVLANLRQSGLPPQTPATVCLPRWLREAYASSGTSMALGASGINRLIDGTVLVIAGEFDVMGDPIQQTMEVNGFPVVFDAIGVGAVRLDDAGRLQALAAGGLKRFAGGGLDWNLPERLDLAVWQTEGQWQGVIQGHAGPLPAALMELTSNWRRVDVPEPMPE